MATTPGMDPHYPAMRYAADPAGVDHLGLPTGYVTRVITSAEDEATGWFDTPDKIPVPGEPPRKRAKR